MLIQNWHTFCAKGKTLLLRSKFIKRKRYEYYLNKLKKTPRYTPGATKLLKAELAFVDAASFLFMHKEIFIQHMYRFEATCQEPVIIDCGANIGLSVIYFKRLYPRSHVIAFEPDPAVFAVLKKNIHRCRFSDVTLVNKALWYSETTREFMSEGADAGRIVELEPDKARFQVSTVRLRSYLQQPVDLLKIDIEGAETEVICDCRNVLKNVKHIFVEYHSFVNKPQTLHTLLAILEETGFRILQIFPHKLPQVPFYQRKKYLGMDLLLNIFAIHD